LEVRYRKQRIRAIIRVYLDELKDNNPEQVSELKSTLKHLREELRAAYQESMTVESLEPFYRLAREERSDFNYAIRLMRALGDALDERELRADLKPHGQVLRDQVDREQLKLAWEEAKIVANDSKEILKDAEIEHRELLKFTRNRISQRIKNIQEILDE